MKIGDVEFMVDVFKEISDKITVCDLDYYIMPADVLDEAMDGIKAKLLESDPKSEKEKK